MFVRKIGIVAIILFVLMIIFNIIIGDARSELLINEHLYLPKPINISNIYRFDFREGEDLSIWYYDDNNFKKVIKNKRFKLIKNENYNIITSVMEKYYNRLDDEEVKLYNENCIIEQLIAINNYYYLHETSEGDTFILIIADSVSKKMYIFNSVW